MAAPTADPLVRLLSEAAGGPAGDHRRTGVRWIGPVCLGYTTGAFVVAMYAARVTGTALPGVLFWAPVLAVCALAGTWLLLRALPDDPWAASALAFSPVLVTVAYAGRALVVVVLVAAVLAAAGRRRVGPPVSVALGVALGVVLALAWSWWRGPHAASSAWTAFAHDEGNRGTLWFVLRQLGANPGAAVIAVVAVLALALGVACVTSLWVAGYSPSPAQAAVIVLVPTFMFGRWYQPGDALWLLPLAAVCGLRWRDQLGWQLLVTFGWAMDLAFDATFDKQSVLQAATGGTPFFTWAMLIRLGGLVWLFGAVVLAVLGEDVGRRHDQDAPPER